MEDTSIEIIDKHNNDIEKLIISLNNHLSSFDPYNHDLTFELEQIERIKNYLDEEINILWKNLNQKILKFLYELSWLINYFLIIWRKNKIIQKSKKTILNFLDDSDEEFYKQRYWISELKEYICSITEDFSINNFIEVDNIDEINWKWVKEKVSLTLQEVEK